MPKPKRGSLWRDITPPVLARLLRPSRAGAPRHTSNGTRPHQNDAASLVVDGHEQSAAYYDDTFHRRGHWLRDYAESHYYPVWAVIADRITRSGVTSIVDLGCGPGQMAALLHEKGVPRYLGVDFSDARIQRARHVRHFDTSEDVRARYGSRLANLEVHIHRADARGRTFYLLDGVKT